MKIKWEQGYDHEEIRPLHKGFHVTCCDCGNTHKMTFKIVKHNGKDAVEFTMHSVPESTYRRRGKLEIKKKILNLYRRYCE